MVRSTNSNGKATHIDVDAVLEPARNGLRGRIDKWLVECLEKARALKIVKDMIDADDRQTAIDTQPKKLIQAMNHRAVNRPEPPAKTHLSREERCDQIRAYLTMHPDATTVSMAEALGVDKNTVWKYLTIVAKKKKGNKPGSHQPAQWTLRKTTKRDTKAVRAAGRAATARWMKKKAKKVRGKLHGTTLSLFLLEQLRPDAGLTVPDLAQRLADAGSPVKSAQSLNGPLGVALVKRGYARRDGSVFFLTATGEKHALALRQKLEAKGTVQAGG